MIDGKAQEPKAISELPMAYCNVPPAVLQISEPIVPELPSGCMGLEGGVMTPTNEGIPKEEFQWLLNAKDYHQNQLSRKVI